jgi:hypothetical protein
MMNTATELNMIVARRLADPANVGIGVGSGVGAVALLALLACGIRRLMRPKPQPVVVEEAPPKVESVTSDEVSEASELDLMESCVDVHKCASASCDICRLEKSVSFVDAPEVAPEFTERMRSANYRWWEKNPQKNRMEEELDVLDEMMEEYEDEEEGKSHHMVNVEL